MQTQKTPLTVKNLSGGIFASTLTPFDQAGGVMYSSITDQTCRCALIKENSG